MGPPPAPRPLAARRLPLRLRRALIHALLIAAALAHWAYSRELLRRDQTPVFYDPAAHQWRAYSFGYPDLTFGQAIALAMRDRSMPYPPGFHLLQWLCVRYFGQPLDSPLLANTLLLLLLMSAVHAIAAREMGLLAGLSAGLSVSLLPLVHGFSRVMMPDLGLAAGVALFHAALLAAVRSGALWRFALAGMAAGFGLSMKQPFLLYAAWGMAWGGARHAAAGKDRQARLRRALSSGAVLALTTTLVALPSYLAIVQQTLERISGLQRGFAGEFAGDYRPTAVLLRFAGTLVHSVRPLLLLLAAAGLLLALLGRSRLPRDTAVLCLGWIVTPLPLLSVTLNLARARYLLPLLPAVLLLALAACPRPGPHRSRARLARRAGHLLAALVLALSAARFAAANSLELTDPPDDVTLADRFFETGILRPYRFCVDLEALDRAVAPWLKAYRATGPLTIPHTVVCAGAFNHIVFRNELFPYYPNFLLTPLESAQIQPGMERPEYWRPRLSRAFLILTAREGGYLASAVSSHGRISRILAAARTAVEDELRHRPLLAKLPISACQGGALLLYGPRGDWWRTGAQPDESR